MDDHQEDDSEPKHPVLVNRWMISRIAM